MINKMFKFGSDRKTLVHSKGFQKAIVWQQIKLISFSASGSMRNFVSGGKIFNMSKNSGKTMQRFNLVSTSCFYFSLRVCLGAIEWPSVGTVLALDADQVWGHLRTKFEISYSYYHLVSIWRQCDAGIKDYSYL